MWIRGSESGVSIWYVCWGASGGSYNVDLYKTSTGLRGWLTSKAYSNIPIHRIGRMEITEAGPVEKEHWGTREEFLKWYRSVSL